MSRLALTLSAAIGFLNAYNAEAVAIFTDFASWSAAVSGVTTETFDNTIPNADMITLDNGIVSTAVPPGQSLALNNVNVSRSFEYVGRVGVTGHPSHITWALPGSFNAFFADFSFLNPNGLFVRGDFDGIGDMEISIADTIGAAGGFGIVGNASFTSFEWDTNDSSEFFAVDNFSLASSVPAPGSLLLIATALFGLAASRRRDTTRQR